MDRNDTSEIVLLIHGTNAGDPCDSGPRWWQRDSDFFGCLSDELGQHFDCQPEGRVFHWSGENSEVSRRNAGEALAGWILDYEKAGRRYHLIGHSHGGSVAWHALRRAMREVGQLDGLKSWTTVGTPFLHFRARPASGWMLLPISAALAVLALSAPAALSYGEAIGELRWSSAGEAAVLLALPLLWAVPLLTVLLVLGRFAALRYAAVHERRETRDGEAVYRALWPRYLGLWSPADEAISGLASTLGLSGAVVPRAKPRGGSRRARLAAALTAPLRWLYNGVVARASDELVWDRVSCRLQGNDRSAYELAQVSRSPAPALAAWPSLPEAADARILALANEQAAATLASVRSMLGLAAEHQSAGPGLVASIAGSVSFRELVHNLYFGDADVAALIAQKVRGAGRQEDAHAQWLAEGQSEEEPAPLPVVPAAPSTRPRMLAKLWAGAAAVVLAGIGLGAGALHAAYAQPYTRVALVERMLADNAAASVEHAQFHIDESVGAWSAAMGRAGLGEPAARMAKAIKNPEARAEALANLAHELAVRGERAEAERTLAAALRVVAAQPLNETPDYHKVVEELAHFGQLDAALALAQVVVDNQDFGDVQAWVDAAVGLVDSGRVDDAFAALARIQRPEEYSEALVRFASKVDYPKLARRALGVQTAMLPRVPDDGGWQSAGYKEASSVFLNLGDAGRSLAAARLIARPGEKADALGTLAGELVKQGRLAEARIILREPGWDDAWSTPSQLVALARMGGQGRDPAIMRRALAMLKRIENPPPLPRGGVRSVPSGADKALVWAEAGDVKRAVAEIEDFGSRRYSEAMEALVSEGKAAAAERQISALAEPSARAIALMALAEANAGKSERTRLLIRAEAETSAILSEEVRSSMTADLAQRWIGLGRRRHALDLAQGSRANHRLAIYAALLAPVD